MIRAYAMGIFPMAEARDDPEVFWVDPRRRGVLPLERFHISRSLRKALKTNDFEVSINQDFKAVVAACADRSETWINAPLLRSYASLHEAGIAHSVEVRRDGALIGGVYGIALGAAFFGESMFSAATNGSKIALAFLVDRLDRGGFRLFDTQFLTDHLASLGAEEISRDAYHAQLKSALEGHGNFIQNQSVVSVQELLHRRTQTSYLG